MNIMDYGQRPNNYSSDNILIFYKYYGTNRISKKKKSHKTAP